MKNVFVFGSNLAGRHGRGAALYAKRHHGAVYGVGVGRQGDSYAIPTKDAGLSPLPLEVIRGHVLDFIEYATSHQDITFLLTAVGCGLAGYTPEDIAPMFDSSPRNVELPIQFKEVMFRS